MRQSRKLMAVVFLLLMSVGPVMAEVKVFDVRHQSAAELVPLLREQVGEEVRISAFQGRIVVNGPSEGIGTVRELLNVLDQPLKQYHIRVRQSVHKSQGGTRAGGQVRIGTGPDSVSAHGQVRLGNTSNSSEQTLAVLEGETGFILVGEDRPYTRQWAAFTGDTEGAAATTTYRSIRTGFSVRPVRTEESFIVLEVAPQMERIEKLDRNPGLSQGPRVTLHRSQSVVRVPVGEWFPLSQNVDAGDAVNREILSWKTGNRYSEREIWIFVLPDTVKRD